jgi:hypothetical protein
MDMAVALVQAYLRVNGYFTVAEFPIIEAAGRGTIRSLTDIDILAFRFPGAGRQIGGGAGPRTVDAEHHEPDPMLGQDADLADMIVGEVKEGRARLNQAARNPAVLRAALVRFGCCTAVEAPEIVAELASRGLTITKAGHRIRLVAFGSTLDEGNASGFAFVPLGHVVEFLHDHLREHWELVRHVQTKEPVLGLLLTLEKARRGTLRPNETTRETDT